MFGFCSAKAMYWLPVSGPLGPKVATARGLTEKIGSVFASSVRALTADVTPRMYE